MSWRKKTMKQAIAMTSGKTVYLSTWQIALAALVLSGISRLMATRTIKRSQKFYAHSLRQASWAPPGWLFGPAWTINNFFLLCALVKILQLEKGPTKNKLLWIQVFIWIIFYSFDYVYFKKKSPFLAAVWTKSDSVLALMSVVSAWNTNRKIAYCYLPLSMWTLYAGTVADYQLLHNSDPVLQELRSAKFIHR
jgi:translocator protein